MNENAVYKLQCITDNPKFEGFAFVRDKSIRAQPVGEQSRLDWDFGPDDVKTKGRAWTITPLADIWIPQPVFGRVQAFNDYPCVNMIIPAFSHRAVDALRDFLEPNGELLPLVSSVGEYYAYNITTVADILDQERSQIEWMSDEHTFTNIADIKRYEFFRDKLSGLTIFRIVEKSSHVYVTQAFVDRINQHGLQGFHLIKMWPLLEGVMWRDEEKKRRKKGNKVETKRGSVPVKGNTVIIMLPTAKEKPNKVEKEQLAKIMDEIDGVLYDPKAGPNTPPLGSLEGDDHHEGQIRLFLSCPDADSLVAKLHGWLKALPWAGPVKVLKRYGEYTDTKSLEEYVDM